MLWNFWSSYFLLVGGRLVDGRCTWSVVVVRWTLTLTFISKRVIFRFLPNHQRLNQDSKVWKKTKYNSFRNKCLIFYIYTWSSDIVTTWKVSKYGVFLVRIFRIQSKCRKIRTRKNLLFGHFSRSVLYIERIGNAVCALWIIQ